MVLLLKPYFGPPFLCLFGFRLLSNLYLFIHYMANHTADVSPRMLPSPYSMSSTNTIGPSLQSDDPTSASYIPRAARTIPTSTTVHTIFIKKITYPFTSRPDELWILERTDDGRETWKPVETFLENMHLTCDRATLRTTANQWRQYYDIPVHSSSSSTATSFPVLPHPEHNNVHVSQPFDAIPDQIHILQSCWGRSAQHHSQGTTTSLSWPPWRSTPPSSPSATTSQKPSLEHTYYTSASSSSSSTTLTNRALWICQTPACNAPLRFATVKKTASMGLLWCIQRGTIFSFNYFHVTPHRPFGNFLTMQLGLNFLCSTPWPHLLLALIHIALHQR